MIALGEGDFPLELILESKKTTHNLVKKAYPKGFSPKDVGGGGGGAGGGGWGNVLICCGSVRSQPVAVERETPDKKKSFE